ncbi:MAG: urea ABC transporter permease subunit UrtB [Opitutus sp.]|nr:urea ABC transporter permease subunit UrtB [Opitutus sp.]
MKFLLRLFCALACSLTLSHAFAAEDETPRQTLARAILAENAATKRTILGSLVGRADEEVGELLVAWRQDALFIYTTPDNTRIPVRLIGPADAAGTHAAVRVIDGEPLTDAAGAPLRLDKGDLESVDHNANLRRAMKAVLDLIDLGAALPAKRIQAIKTIGQSQDAEKLPAIQARLEIETDKNAIVALREARALIMLKSAKDEDRLEALRELKEVHTLSSTDFIKGALSDAQRRNHTQLTNAARAALNAVDLHRAKVDFFGTLFRSLSLGSILLIVALGLAITFGLMGVINMAHGEMIAIGAYTTYVVQNIFGSGLALSPFGISLSLPGINSSGWVYQSYFIVALPLSFLCAAFVGILLERSVIQFLYRRPLESLLATWGVSLILQQILRLTFGANNVQVSSPIYLSGNWTVNDILFGWNRVFVICFAGLIVFGVYLVLTRTSLGLLIRAVMQNRGMAACMGVRTTRVNMLTFGLGSGLAGLAGAFLSQIGNVGPSLGQSYIVDSFMVVVVGGVGNLVGTVISGLGIGSLDQFIQQYSPALASAFATVPFVGGFLQNLAQDSAVFGKILVLCGIILFLQWRPAGLFVTRTRSLD